MRTLGRKKNRISRRQGNSSIFSFLKLREKHEKFEDHYVLDRTLLGRGSFGSVYKAYKKNDRKENQTVYAVKRLDKLEMDAEDLGLVEDEVDAMGKLRHPYIIRFKTKFESVEYFYIVMEYVTGGSLKEYIKEHDYMEESLAKNCVFQIASALDYCAQVGVIHRDIKPSNVLITGDIHSDPLIKLIDFGLSKIVNLKVHDVEAKVLDDWVGTISYSSPEIILERKYNYKTDIWSLGVLTFELISGAKPFKKNKKARAARSKLISKIITGSFNFKAPIWESISNNGKDFISSLLCVKMDDRISGKDVMLHPWLEESLLNTEKEVIYLNQNDRKSIFMKNEHRTKSGLMKQNALKKFETIFDTRQAIEIFKTKMIVSERTEQREKKVSKEKAMEKFRSTISSGAALENFKEAMNIEDNPKQTNPLQNFKSAVASSLAIDVFRNEMGSETDEKHV